MKNNNNETNALSLFDGMSCFQIALKELNIKIDNYYASEVDKHAIAQTKHAFPNTIHLGDVRDIDVTKLPYISILGGGSPCQSFSFAGKMKGMSTKENIKILELDHYLELKSKNFEFEGQSYLFWEYMRILRDIQKYNPNVEFLLENVVMTKEWELVLSRAIGIAPIMINAALVSAQNRKRLYWTNIHNFPQGFLGDPVCEIPQPKDRGILLKDILEPVVDEKYFLSDKMVNTITKHGAIDTLDNDKSNTILASYHKMGGRDQQYVDDFIVAQRGRNPDNPKDRTVGSPTEQMLEPRNDGKTNCLTTVQKDNLVMQINPSDKISNYRQDNPTHIDNPKHPTLRADAGGKLRGVGITIPTINDATKENTEINIYDDYNSRFRTDQKSGSLTTNIGSKSQRNGQKLIIQIPEATKKGYVEIQPGECFDFEHPDSSTRRGRKMTDKSNTLMASETKFMQLTKDFRIRRLTPLECSRLQTVPEWYSWGNTSDTQIYRQLGNGWCIEVIKHILSYSNLNKNL